MSHAQPGVPASVPPALLAFPSWLEPWDVTPMLLVAALELPAREEEAGPTMDVEDTPAAELEPTITDDDATITDEACMEEAPMDMLLLGWAREDAPALELS